jgi:Mg-chelatase subunit ChlD
MKQRHTTSRRVREPSNTQPTHWLFALAILLGACSKAEPATSRTGTGTVGTTGNSATTPAAGSGGPNSSDPNGPATLPPVTPMTPGAASGLDAGAECGRQKFEVQRKPADILLVLDRSGSMKEKPDNDDDDDKAPLTSKWDLVVPALKQVIAATAGDVWWGLSLFPLGDDAGECSADSYPGKIAVPVKPNNATPVNDAITSATPKGDGTPTADAVDEGLKYLQTVQDGNPKYILLATDGEPSCAGTKKGGDGAREAAVTAVQNAATANVHTFVVGIATTKDSASKTLTELAKAGGEAPASGYYLASNKDELVSAMQRIAGSVSTCLFPLGSKPPDPDHVGVLVGTQAVHKDTSGKDGWNFVDAQFSGVELFGPACAAVMSGTAEPVNVVFGCKDDVIF